ncbi:hypothetical protein P879_08021 [Paragonimus westermani]|uniref:Uncharacterized protein n=1 Tax=Paragonimus westermani TaxID=34504 RepID=A0A8T0DBW5_9TREM|nr:hypothetical protein P879_08021 [Paragonimus westermani]
MQPQKTSYEHSAGMAHENKLPRSPKELSVDYSLTSTNSTGKPQCCMLTGRSNKATSRADVPISDSPANVATPPHVSDLKNLVLEQDTQQAVQSPGEEAKIEPNVTNRTSPTLITTELYYPKVKRLPSLEDPVFSHNSYTQGAAHCMLDTKGLSDLSNLPVQHSAFMEAVCN